jgi:ABC-type transport system involved in multi-copper enzyme maturation permease subunit
MESAPQAMPDPVASPPTRASSVFIGRQDYLSVLLRLTEMELYKIRRRSMSTVLSSISIIATLGLFGLIALAAYFSISNGTSLEGVRSVTEALRLPRSLALTEQLLLTLGQILIIILVSTIVGGEYNSGTIRLMLTRGPTRTQFLLSKVGAAIACIGIGVVVVTALGVLAGQLLNVTTGVTPDFTFFSVTWSVHVLLYLLIIILGLFTYAMMALFLSTLGRATATGLAGVLTWSFLIEPVIEIISNFGRNISGPVGSFFQSLPDYLIGTNISTLLDNQNQYVFPTSSVTQIAGVSDIHALLVLAAYIVLFIGLAWWITMRRDVTN